VPDLDIGGEIVWINQVDPLPEVWIYFLSPEFSPGAEIGTFSEPSKGLSIPQDVVVSLTTLSPRFDPRGGLKSPLDNPSTRTKKSSMAPAFLI